MIFFKFNIRFLLTYFVVTSPLELKSINLGFALFIDFQGLIKIPSSAYNNILMLLNHYKNTLCNSIFICIIKYTFMYYFMN